MNKPVKIMLLALLGGAFGLMLLDLTRRAGADSLYTVSKDPASLERAHTLDPQRADIASGLGDAWAAVFPPNPQKARDAYHTAVSLEPCNGLHWIDLARAHLRLGQTAQARNAMAAADYVDPTNQKVQMELGNLCQEFGDPGGAIDHHARAIALNLSYAGNLNPLYLGLGYAPRQIAEHLLKGAPQQLGIFFGGCLAAGIAPAEVAPLWSYLNSARKEIVTPELTRDYFNYLVAQKDFAAARALWKDIARKVYLRIWDETAEPFWNGDLTRTPKFPGGLEWQLTPPESGCAVAIAAAAEGKRAQALEMRFDGTANINATLARHGFFVEPGRAYKLECQVRTHEITTDNGPYLLVQLHSTPPQQQRTKPFLNTGSQPISIEFTAPPDCGWAEVQIRRDHCTRFNNKIKGKAWFEQFTLTSAPAATPAPVREGGTPR